MAALGALSHPAIPPLLAALFGEARDKVRRKALKKTLHRLKTRGVAFADDLLPREEASFGAPRPGAAKVFVSPIFGDGESYVILEGPRRSWAATSWWPGSAIRKAFGSACSCP